MYEVYKSAEKKIHYGNRISFIVSAQLSTAVLKMDGGVQLWSDKG